MGKSMCAIGDHSKRACAYDCGRGVRLLLRWCVRTN